MLEGNVRFLDLGAKLSFFSISGLQKKMHLYNTLTDNNLKYLFLDHRVLSTFFPHYKIVSNSLNKINKIIPLIIFMINSK